MLGVAVVLLGFAAFRESDLLTDDTVFLERYLPTLQSWTESWNLPPGFRDWFGPLHRPLSILSWQLDRAIHGRNWAGHHFTQVLLYGLAAAGFTALLGGLLGFLAPGVEPGRRLRATWFGGALFALHPAHVETAAWLATRHDVLYGSLLMFSLLAAVRGLASERGATQWGWGLTAAALGFLSVQAKESGYAFLPSVLLLCALRRRWRGALLLPVAAALAACLVFRAGVETEALVPLAGDFLTRWLAACGWALTSTATLFAPRIFYDPHPHWSLGIPALLLAVAWLVWGIRRWRRGGDEGGAAAGGGGGGDGGVALFGWVLCGLTLASTWMVAWYPLMTTLVADRYLLLPVGGAIAAVALPLASEGGGWAALRWSLLALFLVVSTRYAAVWDRPARDLGLHMARHAPTSLAARTGGVARALRAGDVRGAREIFGLQPAPVEKPREAGRLKSLEALLLSHEGRLGEAVVAAIESARAAPDEASRWYDLGRIRFQFYLECAERFDFDTLAAELDSVESAFRKALSLDPRHFRSSTYLGKTLVNRARVSRAFGAPPEVVARIFAEAKEHFRRAIRYGAGTEESEIALQDLQQVVLMETESPAGGG